MAAEAAPAPPPKFRHSSKDLRLMRDGLCSKLFPDDLDSMEASRFHLREQEKIIEGWACTWRTNPVFEEVEGDEEERRENAKLREQLAERDEKLEIQVEELAELRAQLVAQREKSEELEGQLAAAEEAAEETPLIVMNAFSDGSEDGTEQARREAALEVAALHEELADARAGAFKAEETIQELSTLVTVLNGQLVEQQDAVLLDVVTAIEAVNLARDNEHDSEQATMSHAALCGFEQLTRVLTTEVRAMRAAAQATSSGGRDAAALRTLRSYY